MKPGSSDLPLKSTEEEAAASLAAANRISIDAAVGVVLSELDGNIWRRGRTNNTLLGGEDVFSSLLTAFGNSLVQHSGA